MQTLYQIDKHSSSSLFIFLLIYLCDKKQNNTRMKREEIRRINARILAKAEGKDATFAAKIEVTPGQLSHLIGENPIRNIGSIIARRIEAAYNKPDGWLDVVHSGDSVDDFTDEAIGFARQFQAMSPEDKEKFRAIFRAFGRPATNKQVEDGFSEETRARLIDVAEENRRIAERRAVDRRKKLDKSIVGEINEKNDERSN